MRTDLQFKTIPSIQGFPQLPERATTLTLSSLEPIPPHVQYVRCEGASFTINLPDARQFLPGRMITLQHNGTSLTQVYTVVPFADQLIQGEVQGIPGTFGVLTLVTNSERFVLISTGTQWIILEHLAKTSWVPNGVLTIGAVTTAPTKPTVTEKDELWWKREGSQVEILVRWKVGAATGSADGSGDYLISLPSTIDFDTAIHPIFAGDIDTTNMRQAHPSVIGQARVGIDSGSNFDAGGIIPFSSTQFRVPLGLNFTSGIDNAWGPTRFAMTTANIGMSVRARFNVAGWLA